MQVVVAGELDPQALQQVTVLRRKEVQKQRLGEYEEAVVTLRSKVRDAEGQAMRETVQDKVTLPSLTPPYPAHLQLATAAVQLLVLQLQLCNSNRAETQKSYCKPA